MTVKVRSKQWMQPLFLLIAGLAFVATGCASLKPVQVVDVSGPDSLLTNEEGTFIASVSPEATQPISGVWDFGDGTKADSMVAQHSYSVAGLYEVTFTASNRKGDDTASDSRSLEVVVEEPIRAPSIVSIDHDPIEIDTRSNATFSARVDEDGREVTGYTWTIDADQVSSEDSFTHTFPNTGTYEVGLTVTNSAGSDNRSVSVDVHPYEAEICRDLTDLNPAFFDRNSSELSADTRTALRENVEILNVCPNTCVSVTGYVDPNERRANELSNARANIVESFYIEQGVPASRIEATGAGRVEGVSRKEGAAQFRRTDSTPMSCSVVGDAS